MAYSAASCVDPMPSVRPSTAGDPLAFTATLFGNHPGYLILGAESMTFGCWIGVLYVYIFWSYDD